MPDRAFREKLDRHLTTEPGSDSELLLSKSQAGTTMSYVVEGEAGIVQFTVVRMPGLPGDVRGSPQAGPMLIHSRHPYSILRAGPCDVLAGGECYLDAGYGAGEECWRLLQENGEQALFDHLEEWYRSRFGTRR